ncbi:putative disease resistance protein [Trifolium repens]|nr:putative disease resistance protein [Trifolium repens]
MESFLCDLVKPYVEKLIDGAIAEARHVLCFTCTVKQFQEERGTLESERKTMEQRVKEAKERDKDIQANVVSWLGEIDELNQVDTKTKQTCFFGFCPDCIWRYKKGKELANNLGKINQLKGKKFENIELSRPLPGVEQYSSKDYISFKSRESKYNKLLEALKDDKNYITGLQGMGGTGKTTLAIKVGKELEQSEQFAYVIVTTVSFTPDIKKIQDDIAGSLGLKWEGCNESDRPKKLWSRLTNGDKILVILDDVWDQDPQLHFDAIGIPKEDNHNGCRVLVTSRSMKTFDMLDCYKRIELDLLSEEEAWDMFKIYAKIGDDSTPKNLIDKGHEIANECKGLPIAISAIARSLKGQQNREHEWDVTLKSLKKPVSMNGVEKNMARIYNCLKTSYDNLMDKNFKGLFLLCSVFREDEEISIEVLTRLCIGVGIFGEDYGYYNDAREKVVVAKNNLVDSCLLLNVDAEHVKMHDLARDAAQWIAKKEIQCVKLFDKKQKSLVENQTNIKHLLCEGKSMDIFNLKLDGSKLETLIVMVDTDDDNNYIVLNTFFENVIKLRVLYFSSNYIRPLPLPPTIQLLTNIRSMSFDCLDLGDISILGKLQSLETLDLVGCKINELPDQIAELKKFKLLKLESCEIRMNNPFEVIKGCSSLEEMYFERSFNDFCQEITLPELQIYHIRNHWKSFYLDRTKFQKYVSFFGNEKLQFSEETLKYCMQTAEVICLERIKGEWRNIMPEIVELGMNDLVELQLSEISQLRCLIDTTGCSQAPNVLSKLVALELKKMGNLEELFNGTLSFESLNNLEKLSIIDCKHLPSLFKGKLNLCNLKSITIQSCPLLVFLFEVSISQSLVLLETLQVSNCEGLKTIIADERREDEEIDDSGNNKNLASVFSKLKVIDIERCHKLESILPFLSAQDLPVLEAIRISECDGLKYVFGQSQHVELVSLSKLKLSKLPKFIGIFEECYDPITTSCVKKGSSSTSNYGSKAQTQLDPPIKCNTFSWWTHICCQTTIPLVDVDGDQPHDYCSVASESNSYCLDIWERVQCLPIQSKILYNIKEIVLTHFPKMKSVFTLSIVPIMQLENLKIMNCDELKHVIIDTGDHNTGGNNSINVFPKLKRLYVKNCEQLEYIFGHDTSDHQNHMEIQLRLPELRRLDLCNLPSLVAMSPKQYQTTFPSLERIDHRDCSQVDIKSIFHSVSESMDHTIIKELSGNVDHFLTLEIFKVHNNSKVKNIFSLNEIDGQQLNLALQEIDLYDLPKMTCLFVGPKNSFALKNLTDIKIKRCDKLKIAFSTSILRFLPQLCYLGLEECKELELVIEDEDLEDKNNSRTCFPKLEGLSIIKCNKLKSVFPFSVCKELPKLNILLITEANELEEIFKSEDDQKVDIPNLKIVAFDMLPSLCCAQGNQFQVVKHRLVRNCQKLTLTSASTKYIYGEIDSLSTELYQNLSNLFVQLQSAEATEDFELPSVENVTDLEILPTNSKLDGSTSEKTEVATVSTISGTKNEPPIQELNYTININILLNFKQGIEIEGTFKTNNDQVSLNDDAFMKVNSNVEEQFSKDEEKTVSKSKLSSPSIVAHIASQFPSVPSKGDPSQKLPSDSEIQMKQTPKAEHEYVENVLELAILPTNSKGLLNEQSVGETDAIVKPSQVNNLKGSTSEKTEVANVSNILGTKNEPPIQVVAKDDEIILSKTKPSPSITSPIASQFPLTPSKGDPSQKVEDLTSYLLVKRELEELISKNHLNYENLSLLTDFLVENPSVRLKDTSLGNIYKGCAYNLLAKLLQFLKTHSLLEVSSSCLSEFLELLQGVRNFAFDMDWMDGVERRALFPEIQVSPDALEKLLDSKKRITKVVEDLRFKIDILSQHVEDLKHQLTLSEADLESIIQQEAVLSAPIGY